MTSTQIAEFYRRLRHELENRTARKQVQKEIRDIRSFLSYTSTQNPHFWHDVLQSKEDELKELQF